MSETESKLAHLLPHWVEHNDAHLDGYRKWADRARQDGLDAVAEELDAAIENIGRANDALRRARERLPG